MSLVSRKHKALKIVLALDEWHPLLSDQCQCNYFVVIFHIHVNNLFICLTKPSEPERKSKTQNSLKSKWESTYMCFKGQQIATTAFSNSPQDWETVGYINKEVGQDT